MLGRGLLIAGACALALGSFTPNAWAQDDESVERPKYAPLKLDLGKGRFLRFITWHQIWTRFTELNPGSTVNGTEQDDYFDIGLRRSRFLAFAQLNEFQILTHFGINNQTFNNQRKPQLFMHDVWTQYSLFKNYVSVGFGLHYWHGISRFTNASTLNFMTLDAPITNWPTIERTDQFARFLGIWLKGQIDSLDYRVSFNKPFVPGGGLFVQGDGGTAPGVAAYNPNLNTVSIAGYFEWQFMDKESDTLPYKVGTYIGGKKVFNVGAGFYWHPDSMASQNDTFQRELHDQVLIGVDVYADMPIGDKESGGAFNAYLVYYNYDFGPNHIRNIGIMNIADGGSGTSLNGQGNAQRLVEQSRRYP